MQAYAGLPILTAQPKRPTRLVAIWPLSHEGSVAEYAREAHAAIDEVVGCGRTAVVAGGTGLYLRYRRRLPPGSAIGGSGHTTALARRGHTVFWSNVIRRRPHGCMRTIDVESCGRSS
jgi:hypothetical protein